MKKGIVLFLAGVGGLWMWSRYNDARKAGVPWMQAIKHPFSGVAELTRRAASAVAPGAPAHMLPDVTASARQATVMPRGTEIAPQAYDPDDVLVPEWMTESYD